MPAPPACVRAEHEVRPRDADEAARDRIDAADVDAADRPERFVGLHFFDLPHATASVEVVRGERTAAATERFAVEFVEGLGREPVVVRDSPGFVTSRLCAALAAEATRTVETGVASVADADRAMELGYDHPVGPLERSDVAGRPARGARTPPRGAGRAVPNDGCFV